MLSRRAWIAALPSIAAAAQQARSSEQFEFFSKAQARDAAAIAERIIPADDTPGATGAGVIYFIDRALSRFFRDQQVLYRGGLSTLAGFADLTTDQQIARLRAIEKTPFFEAIRTHTIMGFLADPQYGGNRNKTGWTTIGFTASHVFRPPFGAYDGNEP